MKACSLLLAVAACLVVVLQVNAKKKQQQPALQQRGPLWTWSPPSASGYNHSGLIGVAPSAMGSGEDPLVYVATWPNEVNSLIPELTPLHFEFFSSRQGPNHSAGVVNMNGENFVTGDYGDRHAALSKNRPGSGLMTVGVVSVGSYAFQYADYYRFGNETQKFTEQYGVQLWTKSYCDGFMGIFPCQIFDGVEVGNTIAGFLTMGVDDTESRQAIMFSIDASTGAPNGDPIWVVPWDAGVRTTAVSDSTALMPINLNGQGLCGWNFLQHSRDLSYCILCSVLPHQASKMALIHGPSDVWCTSWVTATDIEIVCFHADSGNWTTDKMKFPVESSTTTYLEAHMASSYDWLIVAAGSYVRLVPWFEPVNKTVELNFLINDLGAATRFLGVSGRFVVQATDNYLLAFDHTTRALLWKTALRPSVASIPALAVPSRCNVSATSERAASLATFELLGDRLLVGLEGGSGDCSVVLEVSLHSGAVIAHVPSPFNSTSTPSTRPINQIDTADNKVTVYGVVHRYKIKKYVLIEDTTIYVPFKRADLFAVRVAHPLAEAEPLLAVFQMLTSASTSLPWDWAPVVNQRPRLTALTGVSVEMASASAAGTHAMLNFSLHLPNRSMSGQLQMALPKDYPLRGFNVSSNALSPAVVFDFRQLPTALQALDVSKNPSFCVYGNSGTMSCSSANITFASDSQLRVVDFSQTAFDGTVQLNAVPVGTMERFDLRGTQVSVVVVSAPAKCGKWLLLEKGVTCVGN